MINQIIKQFIAIYHNAHTHMAISDHISINDTESNDTESTAMYMETLPYPYTQTTQSRRNRSDDPLTSTVRS